MDEAAVVVPWLCHLTGVDSPHQNLDDLSRRDHNWQRRRSRAHLSNDSGFQAGKITTAIDKAGNLNTVPGPHCSSLQSLHPHADAALLNREPTIRLRLGNGTVDSNPVIRRYPWRVMA